MQIKLKSVLCLAMGISLLLSACGDEELMLDEELVAPFYLGYTDTISLKMSTIIADSLVSSGTGRILSGYYEDEKLGKVRAESYFQLGLNGTVPSDEDLVYDSLILYFTNNDYIYGDSTQIQHFSLHRLTEEMSADDDGYFYNTQSLPYADSVLGEISFLSSTIGRDSLAIHISDDWGQELMELALNNSSIYDSDDEFQEYLPGIALVADSTQNTAVLGYTASTESVYLRLYYHETTEELERSTYDFPLVNTSMQFNHIASDRSATALASLHSVTDNLPDSSTQMETYVQGGTGIVTRLNIPTLQDFPELGDYIYVTNVDLIIEPVISHTQDFSFPDSLMLLSASHINEVNPLLSYGTGTSSTEVWTSVLELDDEYDRETQYSFNITDYVNQILLNDEINDSFFLLTIPSYRKSVHRLFVGSSQNEEYVTRLEISYTQLNSTY